MKRLLCFFLFFIACTNRPSDQHDDVEEVVLRSIHVAPLKNQPYISLIQRRFSGDTAIVNRFVLKISSKEYELKSYFAEANLRWVPDETSIELLSFKKSTQSSSKAKNDSNFVIKLTQRGYQSFTFLENRNNVLYVTYFFETIFVDDSCTRLYSVLGKDDKALYSYACSRLNIKATDFFSKEFILDSINLSCQKINCRYGTNQWQNELDTEEEKWVNENW